MKIIKNFFDIFYNNKIIIFFLVCVLLSFNAPFLFLHDFKNFNFYSIFLIFQYVLPLTIFSILIFYIYKLNYLKNFLFNTKYIIFKFLFFLNFIQIFGIFFNNINYFTPIDENSSRALTPILLDWKSSYTRIIFIINNFNVIFIGFLCLKKNKVKFNLCFLIGFFLITSFYYCYKISHEYFANIDTIINFYSSSVLFLGTNTLNFTNPRATGLARIILLISIFFSMLYLFYKTKYILEIKPFRYLIVLLIIFLNFFVIQLQSRTSIYFLYLLPIFFLTFFYFYKARKFFFILILLIGIPFLLSQIVVNYKLNLLEKKLKTDTSLNEQEILTIINNNRISANRTTQETTSGRIDIWYRIVSSYKEIPLLGYGVLGDKFVFSVSASNIFLYFFISGGIIGFLGILLFNIYIFKNIFYLLISRKLFTSNNAFLHISFFFVCFFLLRSIVENSYGQFGIDFIFFVPSYLIFESYLKKFKIV